MRVPLNPVPMNPVPRRPAPDDAEPINIDCGDCALQASHSCDDCLVSFVISRDPDDAVVIDVDEARAIRALEDVGLLPPVRFSGEVG